MTRVLLFTLLLVAVQPIFAQGTVVTDAKLPPDSIELKRNDPSVTSTPWQLPKPGDPLYDAEKEGQIRRENKATAEGNSHPVCVFERGVFKGYQTLSWGKLGERPAKEMNDAFTPNAKLPLDAVQPSDGAQPEREGYFPSRLKTRPANVPPDCIAVKAFHRGKLIGWTFMPEQSVALLHQPK
jgi:hypothetical protein